MTASKPANKPVVIDIYYGDQVEDFALTKAFGIVGVIHKRWEELREHTE